MDFRYPRLFAIVFPLSHTYFHKNDFQQRFLFRTFLIKTSIVAVTYLLQLIKRYIKLPPRRALFRLIKNMLETNKSRAIASLFICSWAILLHYNVNAISNSDLYKDSLIGRSQTQTSYSFFGANIGRRSRSP